MTEEKSKQAVKIGIIVLAVIVFGFIVEITNCPYCKGTGTVIWDFAISGRQRVYCTVCGGDGSATLYQYLLGLYNDLLYPPDGYGS